MASSQSNPSPPPGALKRTLGPVMLWGLGVGYVISGEYFGWNLGLPLGGTYGMLAAMALVTVMYVTFILSYSELACAIPHAGGAFAYGMRAFGPIGGYIAGTAQLIEFIFATPAVAMAIGAYVAQRYSNVSPQTTAIAAYFLFTAINAWGVKQAAILELLVTIVAVFELLIFMGFVAPAFKVSNLTMDAWPNGWSGAFACIPFAIWFYLALEGVANAAEEVKNPQRDITRGFGAAMLTLVVLAVGVFFAAVGVAGWRAIVYPVLSTGQLSTVASDAPLPLALSHVVARDSWLYTMLLGIGLIGLIASFHGIILAASRATMAFGRAGFAPSFLGDINPRLGTPVKALVVNMALGIVAIVSGRTSEIITLSCFGAATLYIISMLALFRLRRIAPDLQRPFRTVGYPWVPGIAFTLACVSLIALTVYNVTIALLFFGIIAAVLIAFGCFGTHDKARKAPSYGA